MPLTYLHSSFDVSRKWKGRMKDWKRGSFNASNVKVFLSFNFSDTK
jgi:hypothetical protein